MGGNRLHFPLVLGVVKAISDTDRPPAVFVLSRSHPDNAMFERFTEKAIKVIMLAQEECRSFGHDRIGTEFLLLGVIGEGTGLGAKVLA